MGRRDGWLLVTRTGHGGPRAMGQVWVFLLLQVRAHGAAFGGDPTTGGGRETAVDGRLSRRPAVFGPWATRGPSACSMLCIHLMSKQKF